MNRPYPEYLRHLRAARTRDALRYLPRNGKRNVLFCTSDRTAVGYYRCYLPSVFLHKHSAALNAVVVGALDDHDILLDWADIIVWNKLYDDYHRAALDRARERGKINLYEIDDFLHAEFDKQSFFYGYTPDTPAHKGMVTTMNHCDALLVSTDYLRDCYSGMVDAPIHVVRNAVDIDHTESLTTRYEFPRVRIVWQGGPSHYEDLQLLRNPLARIKDEYGKKVKITLFGFNGNYCDSEGRWHVADVPCDYFAPAESIDDFFPRMAKLSQHIGLCPLVDDQFNRAKSNLKWLDYSAFGLATVASNVGPYAASISDGVDGLLVDNTDDAWYAALRTLIDNASKRDSLAAAAAATVRSTYNARSRWRDYEALLCSLPGCSV